MPGRSSDNIISPGASSLHVNTRARNLKKSRARN